MYKNNIGISDYASTVQPCIPVENAPLSIIDTVRELYATLNEIESVTHRINGMLFGPINSDMCRGEPDCLQAEAAMALDMARMIREELYRIQNGLGGM